MQVPIVLYVLDRESYVKVKGTWPLPFSTCYSKLCTVVFPTHIEDLLGEEPNAKTPGEYIAYHEAGHDFTYELKIRSGNRWVNELVANLFMAAYIDAKRPDLKWALEGPEAHGMKQPPRYTSLRDLDYVYAQGVGPQNYAWFQHQIERLAEFMVAGQSLPAVMKKLQAEFPLDAQKQETLDQIVGRLDHVRPGTREFLNPLYGHTTLALVSPSPCSPRAADTNGQASVIAVRNDSGHPLEIVGPDGMNETLAPAAWDDFSVRAGDSLKLPVANAWSPAASRHWP